MVIVVRVFGIVIVSMGILFLIKPNALKQLVGFVGQGKRLYAAGSLRILIGGVLLFAAPHYQSPEVIIALGILFLAGGIAIFALGLEKIKSLIGWFNKKSLLTLRFLGIVPLVVGILLIHSA